MTNPRTAYRENDVRGATAVRLVVLLYEQLVQDLSQALHAIEQNDIELRTKRINHAILVIGHLQSPLDFANGGKVALDLDHFYNVVRQNLVHVQFHPSQAGLSQQITDLLAVREAWTEVERGGEVIGRHCDHYNNRHSSFRRVKPRARVSACALESMTPPDAVETLRQVNEESLEYRTNLEKLKDFLPDLHGRLLAEKSRLEMAQTHVGAAAAWARASKKTL